MKKILGLSMLITLSSQGLAAVSQVSIESVQPFADGAKFGKAGAYEIVTGRFVGELDTEIPQNKIIVGLKHAKPNQNGRVEYSSKFAMLRPVDPSLSSNILLYDVPNRGRKFSLLWVLDGQEQSASSINDPKRLEDGGNGLFMRRGYTLVWSGWEPDLNEKANLLTLKAPIAYQPDGSEIISTVREEELAGGRRKELSFMALSYKTASLDTSKSTLRVKYADSDSYITLGESDWQFIDDQKIALLPKGSKLTAGALYDFRYPAKNPTVSGIGFAATRDLVAYLRDPSQLASTPVELRKHTINHTMAIGISQSGRYLRDYIQLGFNQDEKGQKVFDGVFSYISGAGGLFLNEPFSQPGRTHTAEENRYFPEIAPPFSVVKDKNGLSRLRYDQFDPLWMEANTSSEYWQKSAALLHTSPDLKQDLVLPNNYRVYLIAGTQHGGRSGLTPGKGVNQANKNPHNPAAALRALIVGLEQWVVNGQRPPESRVPNLKEGTLVHADRVNFPLIPGFITPKGCNDYMPFDNWRSPTPDANNAIACLVPQVDPDGNEIGGIRLPDIAVPLGTYTGWNLFAAPFPVDGIADRDGAYSPFPLSEKMRQAANDPRKAILQRYPTHKEYLADVKKVSAELVKAGYLLPEDAFRYINQAQSMQSMWLFSLDKD
jgi:hypothetical protein